MKISFIRHGKTLGNLQHRYVGRTDEELCKEGVQDAYRLKSDERYKNLNCADVIFVSPMKRCIQTVEILFCNSMGRNLPLADSEVGKSRKLQIIDDFREYDFGEYEMKNHEELMEYESYVKWLESNGAYEIPAGEGIKAFKKRVIRAFDSTINICNREKYNNAVYVVHGGTIMSILEQYDSENKSYYDYMIKNLDIYTAIWDGEKLLGRTEI